MIGVRIKICIRGHNECQIYIFRLLERAPVSIPIKI